MSQAAEPDVTVVLHVAASRITPVSGPSPSAVEDSALPPSLIITVAPESSGVLTVVTVQAVLAAIVPAPRAPSARYQAYVFILISRLSKEVALRSPPGQGGLVPQAFTVAE